MLAFGSAVLVIAYVVAAIAAIVIAGFLISMVVALFVAPIEAVAHHHDHSPV